MRVTTANSSDRSIATLQQRQQALNEAQAKLTSGKKMSRASDDPTAAARAERALASVARADASQRGLEASRNATVLAESALGDAGELLQSARELTVQAGNASFDDNQRKSLANAVRSLRNQLLQVANRGDGAGGYLFGGQGSAESPFVDAPGGVQFRGTEGVNMAASGEPLPLTADGNAAFLRASSGNGVFVTAAAPGNSGGAWVNAGRVVEPSVITGDDYSLVFHVDGAGNTTFDLLRAGVTSPVTDVPYVAGQAFEFDGMTITVNGKPGDGDRFDATPSARDLSVFDALDRLANDLQTPGRAAAEVTQTVQAALRDIDSSASTLIAERARLGEVLNRTDGVEGRIAQGKLLAQSERSAAEDIDMVQAVSDFSARQTSYDAALKAYSMVQKLSLFQYIG